MSGLPGPMTELLRRAAELLDGAETRLDGSRVLTVETLLRDKGAKDLLADFERFYQGDGAAAVVLDDTPMEARLTVVPSRGATAVGLAAEIFRRLKDKGIVSGVRDDVIRAASQAAARRETLHRLVVAAGTPGRDGEDGSISFAVRAFDKRLLLDTEDSYFGDLLGLVEEVKAGALVARITPMDPGQAGRDLRGAAKPAKPGRPLSLAIGEGLQLQAEGKEVHALGRGSLIVGEDTLDLVPFHVVDGALAEDLSFDGHVLVTGHVQGGPLRIQARDIYVAGNVEAAQLMASGDVWVGGAIRGKSAVDAEGRVVARSFSDVSVRAVGDVAVADSIVESRVSSSGRVSTRGAIESGDIAGFRGVAAGTVGSMYGLTTTIKVGAEDFRGPLRAELEKRIRENEEALAKIDDLKARFSASGRKARDLGAEQQGVYISVLRKEIQALEEIRSLRRRRKRLDAGREEGEAPALRLGGALIPPVTVGIGDVSTLITERIEGGALELGPDRKIRARKAETSERRTA